MRGPLKAALGAVLCWSCSQARSPLVQVEEWHALVAEKPGAFRALYRLTCCGISGGQLALATDGERVSLQLVVLPKGVVWAAFWGEELSVWDEQGDCTYHLAEREGIWLDKLFLPVNKQLFLLALAGKLPPGVRPGAGGWVVADQGDTRLRWYLQGNPARWVKWEVSSGERAFWVEAGQHHGRVPGRLRGKWDNQQLELELVEFGPVGNFSVPAWTGAPLCGGPPR